MTDRYLKIVLTVIALELFWLGVKDLGQPVAAQTAAARVVIAGVDVAPGTTVNGALPVIVRPGDVALRIQADRADRPLQTMVGRPVRIETDRPLPITIDRPVKVEADTPLKVEQIGYVPARRPGE